MYLKVLSLVCAVLAAILYCKGYKNDILNYFQSATNGDILFSAEELSRHDGEKLESMYLSIMGKIYDVTKGKKHYGSGANYNIFIGRDASKSFITGEFSDTSKNLDDVLELSNSDILGLEKWQKMYEEQYVYKGKLIGRFYNQYGKETDYLKNVQIKIENARVEKFNDDESKRLYPLCNIEWDATKGSRVWCTNKSGGISRNWEGVPRQMHTPGQSVPQCVCVNTENDKLLTNPNLKIYEGCNPKTNTCYVNNI